MKQKTREYIESLIVRSSEAEKERNDLLGKLFDKNSRIEELEQEIQACNLVKEELEAGESEKIKSLEEDIVQLSSGLKYHQSQSEARYKKNNELEEELEEFRKARQVDTDNLLHYQKLFEQVRDERDQLEIDNKSQADRLAELGDTILVKN